MDSAMWTWMHTLRVLEQSPSTALLRSCLGKGCTTAGVLLHAQATPHFGYVFSHWTSNDGNYNNEGDDSLEILLNTNTELVANFDTCSAVIDVDIVADGNVLRSEISEDVSGVVYNWTLNGITISEDSVLFNPTNGNYGLTVRFDSCEIATEIFTVERESYSVLLFPNPAIDQLHVQFILGTQSDMNMRIFNTSGQEVWQNSRADFIGQFNETIDVSGLARGTYISAGGNSDRSLCRAVYPDLTDNSNAHLLLLQALIVC